MPFYTNTTLKPMNATVRTYELLNGVIYGEKVKTTVSNASYESWLRNSATTPGFGIKKFVGGGLQENPFEYKFYRDSSTLVGSPCVKSSSTYYGSKIIREEEGVSTSVILTDNSVSNINISALESRAVNDLLLKIKDQKINVAQAFAERQQLVDLVASTATRLVNAIRGIKRGNIADAASALGLTPTSSQKRRKTPRGKVTEKFISRSWLELQYGWLPLLGDIDGAAEELATVDPLTRLIRAETHKRFDDRINTVVKTADSTTTTVKTVKYDIRYGVSYYLTDSGLNVAGRIGLTNPLLIAWELLPWSFVIDWFIPVGDYISSFDATLGLAFNDGYRTDFHKENVRITRQFHSNSGADFARGSVFRDLEDVQVTRARLLKFPSSRPPAFKNPISVTHALNALSLLSQLRK